MTVGQTFKLLKQTGSDWAEDKVPRLSAALAFYTMLSIGPLLILAIKIIGWIFKEKAAVGEVKNFLGQMGVGTAAPAIEDMIRAAGDKGGWALAISMVVLLFSASGVFGELQDSMNTIWEVKPKPNRGIMGILKDRFFSFTMVMGVVFLLLVSLVISTVLAAVSSRLGGEQNAFWQIVNFVVSFGVITVLFALIFKYLPDVKLAWRDVWVGAIITSVLFTIGKFALGWYLGRASTTSVYGAAGSFVALLLWVYYSSQIMFFGAEFVQAWTKRNDRPVQTQENAVPVTKDERAQQGMASTEDMKLLAAAAEAAPGRPVVLTPRPGCEPVEANELSWKSRLLPLALGFAAAQVVPMLSKRNKPVRRVVAPGHPEHHTARFWRSAIAKLDPEDRERLSDVKEILIAKAKRQEAELKEAKRVAKAAVETPSRWETLVSRWKH